MENVYVVMVYVAALVTLVGCVLLKVGDILEKKRDQKYYQMIRDDAAFWQFKLEQTGMNITEWIIDQGMDKMMEKVKDMTAQMTGYSGKPKEADEKFKEEFEGLDEWLPF